MRKSCGNCRRRNSLTSRVHQNSPRTRLLASNRMMLHQRRCRLVPSSKANASGLAKGVCVPTAQEFGYFTSVCHRSRNSCSYSTLSPSQRLE